MQTYHWDYIGKIQYNFEFLEEANWQVFELN